MMRRRAGWASFAAGLREAAEAPFSAPFLARALSLAPAQELATLRLRDQREEERESRRANRRDSPLASTENQRAFPRRGDARREGLSAGVTPVITLAAASSVCPTECAARLHRPSPAPALRARLSRGRPDSGRTTRHPPLWPIYTRPNEQMMWRLGGRVIRKGGFGGALAWRLRATLCQKGLWNIPSDHPSSRFGTSRFLCRPSEKSREFPANAFAARKITQEEGARARGS